MNKVVFSKNTDEWETPKKLFEELNKEFNFDVDLCSTDKNALCKKHYTKENCILDIKQNEVIFCNPPYSQNKIWVNVCNELNKKYNCTCVMLLPARTDTKWFHEYIYKKHEIRFIKGRLHFSEKGSAPFPSMIVVMKGQNK